MIKNNTQSSKFKRNKKKENHIKKIDNNVDDEMGDEKKKTLAFIKLKIIEKNEKKYEEKINESKNLVKKILEFLISFHLKNLLILHFQVVAVSGVDKIFEIGCPYFFCLKK